MLAQSDRRLDEIVPGLFISDAESAADLELLYKHRIEHVLDIGCHNCDADGQTAHLDDAGISSRSWDLADWSTVDILSCCAEACPIIARALGKDEAVLVHCGAGISRSVSVVCSYLMRSRGMWFQDALNLVTRRRSCAWPNAGFREQLEAWFAKCSDTCHVLSLSGFDPRRPLDAEALDWMQGRVRRIVRHKNRTYVHLYNQADQDDCKRLLQHTDET